MKMRILLSFLLLFGLALSVAAPSAQAAEMLADLENALMCKCDDKCGKVLINCTCATSDKTRAEFTKLLESGLTVQNIIDQQVEKYGETVLSAPTKDGFNLTAWVMPFAALMVGGLGIGKIIEVWKKRAAGSAADSDTDTAPKIPSKYSNRLKQELDEIEF